MLGLLTKLEERYRAGELHVAGVLSGTSADGIDVGIARFHPGVDGRPGAPQTLAFETRPFEPALSRELRALLDGDVAGPARLARLDRDLGCAFGRAAREVAEAVRLPLDLLGSHGQTVFHHDGDADLGPCTLQLGEGDHVARAAGCPVVCDFRQADLAAGGQGAPISVYADDLIFAEAPRPLAVLNLGGMGNVSFLCGGDPLSFDTGPAGSLLDGLARRLLDRPFDEGGEVAAGGTVDPRWVGELLEHPFLAQTPPRSTGRDTFGEAWVSRILERARALELTEPADLLASAATFVAISVAQACERLLPEPPRELLVCGGGIHHRHLRAELEARLPCAVHSSDHHGVNPDAREALVFAVLALRALLGEAVTHPSATGADRGTALGKLAWGPVAWDPEHKKR